MRVSLTHYNICTKEDEEEEEEKMAVKSALPLEAARPCSRSRGP